MVLVGELLLLLHRYAYKLTRRLPRRTLRPNALPKGRSRWALTVDQDQEPMISRMMIATRRNGMVASLALRPCVALLRVSVERSKLI